MDHAALTIFPNLHATQAIPDSGPSPTDESFPLPLASQESLLVAWGRLIQAYTGEKRIVHSSNGGQVIIFGGEDADDSASHATQKVLPKTPDNPTRNATGLYFGEDGAADLALRLSVYPEKSMGRLSASNYIPQQQLPAIRAQYLALVHEILQSESSGICEAVTPLLSTLNHPPEVLPCPDLLHDLIDQHANDADIAVEHLAADGVRTPLSYRMLRSKARVVAATITAMLGEETQRREVIPVLLPQGPPLYWTLLGILQSGCAFCPLNLDAPEERIRFIANDVSAKVIATSSALQTAIPRLEGVQVVNVDELGEQLHKTFTASPTGVDDPAYVMYTSGSTGVPKGVELSHKAVTQSLQAHQIHIPEFSRFLQFAAPTFDVSMFEIFFTLFRGATIVSCDRHHLLNNLATVVKDMDVDAAELTPTVAASLLSGRESVPGLNVLLTIGEMLTANVVHDYGGSATDTGILHGMYGPTEAAIHCTLESSFDAGLRPGIIGRPLATVSAFIVAPSEHDSDFLRLLPQGFLGELAVGGPQLATGYLNRPEQNAKAYVNHPVYGRLYRTGDKARFLPDGRIECFGRIGGGQVKLRGQRIELGEIESTALQDPACKVSVASVIEGSLVLFCAGDSAALTGPRVLERCRTVLPKFMVPGDVRILSAFPQLPSGKIDKRTLEEQYLTSVQGLDDQDDQPADSFETQLSQAISELSGRKIRPLSNLSESGIDSLRAIQIASRLRRAGWDLSASDLLKSRNVAQLSYQIRERASADSSDLSESIANTQVSELESAVKKHLTSLGSNSDVERVLPCTPVQLSMLAETAVRPTAYFNSFTFEFPDASIDHVMDCVRALADANAILRSGFCELEEAAQPYALVVWKRLQPWQIRRITAIGAREPAQQPTFVRPLRVDVKQSGGCVEAIFNIHHALYDGWSVDLILEELSIRLRNETPPARESYAAICEHWAKQRHSDASADKEFWGREMQDFTTQTLPNLTGRSVQSDDLVVCTRNLSVNTGELQMHAAWAGVSNQSVAQASLAYLLSAYYGSDDITFATVTSGRTQPVTGIEGIVGPCLATLPFRVPLCKRGSGTDLLRQIHQKSRTIMEHDILTLGEIKRICGVPAGSPLCDALFVWQETLTTPTTEPGNVRLAQSNDELEFALVVEVEPRQDAIGVTLRYRKHLFPQEHARLFLDQFDQAVKTLLIHSDDSVQSLYQYFSPSILSLENLKHVSNTFTTSLTSAVESHALNRAHEGAIMFCKSLGLAGEAAETITYSQLNGKANSIARQLQEGGVIPNDLVVICMEKSPLLYISILAVLKAGAGYVPITPSTPTDRIAAILDDSDPRLCLIDSTASDVLPKDVGRTTIKLDISSIDALSLNPLLPYVGSHAAYAVYTSGSTGTPKGLLVTQDNLQSNLKELSEIYPNRPHDRLLQSCSQAFDVSVFEIFFTWQQGMCLCSASNDDLFRDLEHAMRSMRISHLSLTPTVAALINPDQVPDVKFLVTAGEAVTEQVFRRWAGKGLLYQGYGPAETVNICTVRPQVAVEDLISNIGRPLANTSTVVLPPDSLDPVPRGGIGELCFGGDQVCRGYIKRDHLTHEKFIEHPQFGRIYRSGDLGRLLVDGSILFVGRADDQVKIRGQRIELGEINSTIIDHTFVSDCTSLVVTSAKSSVPVLVAFWVSTHPNNTDPNAAIPSATLQAHRRELFQSLRAKLPTYMVPSNLIPLTSLPRTVQGKIDKRVLQARFEALSIEEQQDTCDEAQMTEDTESMSDSEEAIAGAIAQVLKIAASDIRRHSAFFSLGLDSISAIRLSQALRRQTGQEVLVSTILKHPSVARLARAISQTTQPTDLGPATSDQLLADSVLGEIRSSLASKSLEWRAILPCTPLQISMLSATLSSTSAAYCNRTSFKLQSKTASIKDAILAVIARHPIFQTVFIATSDMEEPYVQVLLAQTEPSVQDGRAQQLSADKLQEELRTDVIARLRASQPPYSIAFAADSGVDYVHIVMHHSLYDGIAMGVVINEIENLCSGNSVPEPASFEPFLTEVAKQQSSDAVNFWTERLDDFLPTQFPRFTGIQDVGKDNVRYTSVSTDLPYNLATLEDGCRQLNVTLSAVVQSAWAKVLSAYTGAADVCFGRVISGRHLPIDAIERLVAPCFNTIPVRADLLDVTTLDLLEQLQEQSVDALTYSLTSLRRIQNALNLDGAPLFDSIVLLQETETEVDSSLWRLVGDEGTMDFPLILEVVPYRRDNQIKAIFHFANDILLEADAESLALIFCAALQSCIDSPQRAARSIARVGAPKLSPSESTSGWTSLRYDGDEPGPTDLKSFEQLLRDRNRNVRDGALSRPGDQHHIMQAAVVGVDGEALQTGLVGELVLRQSLHTSPEKDHTSQQLLRSGMLARLTCDGQIQVISLSRTATESIISALRDVSGVVDVALGHMNRQPGKVSIFVQVQGRDRSTIEKKITDCIEDRLPSSMTPDRINFVKSIPYTRTGRVHMKSLARELIENQLSMAHSGDHAWSATATSIRKAFQKVSRRDINRIGPNTSIFQLGIDSIGAVQVATFLRKSYGQVTSNDVMEHPTCTALAALLETTRPNTMPSDSTNDATLRTFDQKYRRVMSSKHDVGSLRIELVLPCTPMQSGLLASSTRAAGQMYINHICLDIPAKFSGDEVQDAWCQTVASHQMLRTGFGATEASDFPFAMIWYRFDSIVSRWITQDSIRPAAWRNSSVQEMSAHLHEPQWRGMIEISNEGRTLHLLLHHALYDARSLEIMIATFGAALNGNKLPTEPSILPSLSDIIETKATRNRGNDDFWKQRCEGMGIHKFPNMSPLVVQSSSWGQEQCELSIPLRRLESSCADLGVTTQAVAQAAYALVLSSYIGEPGVTFGVVLSGRGTEEANATCFPHLVTVPFSCNTATDNKEILKQAMTFGSAVRKHQFTSLAAIQRLAGYGQQSLFDTVLAYQRQPPNTDRTLRHRDVHSVTEYPVSLELEATTEDSLLLRITYNTAVLPYQQANLLMSHFDAMLLDLIGQSPATTDDETFDHSTLVSFKPPKEVVIPSPVRLVHEWVEQQAVRYPDRIALEFATSIDSGHKGRQRWSYAELDKQADILAFRLLQLGVKVRSNIAICFDKCPEASFATVGILKAGCAFVAIDPKAPPDRVRFILEDSKSSIVVSHGSIATQVAGLTSLTVLDLADPSFWAFDDIATQPQEIEPADTCYCLYTSGTTGTPKGCEITHENVVQALLSFQRLFDGHWNIESRWLQFASFHFDVSVLEQFWSWSVGICVVSAPRDLIFEDIARTIDVLQITHIDLTPSLAKLVTPEDVPTLCKGVFITGGEKLHQDVLDTWGPKQVIYNGYGPTEATIGVTMFPRVPENGKPSNIGWQFDNVGTVVLAPGTDIPVFRGGVGELCVTGKLVGKGYLNRPELTSQRFPVLEHWGGKAYRTGDLVRMLHDDSFDFVGRIDGQVKLRGQRLEVGEIDHTIKAAVPAVQDLATLVVTHPSQNREQLVCFLSITGLHSRQESLELTQTKIAIAAVEQAADACRNKLPPYMVPSQIIPLNRLPLSSNNKADANALKLFYATITPESLMGLARNEDGPQHLTSEEAKVGAVVSDFLEFASEHALRPSSNLYELGLDSITALGLARRLKKAGYERAMVSVIAENPTLRKLAKGLEGNNASERKRRIAMHAGKQNMQAVARRTTMHVCSSIDVKAAEIETLAPCTPLQQGIISRALDSNGARYYVAFYFKLQDDTSLDRLKQAWQKVHRGLAVLRTQFVPTDEGYVQVVRRSLPLAWVERTLEDDELPEEELRKVYDQWLTCNSEVIVRPFEVVVLRRGRERIMALHLFHALYDATSLDLLLRVVSETYHGKTTDLGPSFFEALPHGPLQKIPGAERFWTQHLKDFIAIDSHPPSSPDDHGIVRTAQETNLKDLESRRCDMSVTKQALLQACWIVTLAAVRRSRPSTGMITSGRSMDFQNIDRVVGPLFNTLPFTMSVDGHDTWRDIVTACHRFNIAVMQFQHTPLRDIQKWSHLPAGTSLFDSIFVFQRSQTPNDLPPLWKLEDARQEVDYPLACEVEETMQNTLRITIVASSDHTDHEQVELILTTMQKCLSAMLRDPDSHLDATLDIAHEQNTETTAKSSQQNGHIEKSNDAAPNADDATTCLVRTEIAALAGLDAPSIRDAQSILELGLDSIDAIKLSSRLSRRLQRITVSQIMKALTVHRISAILQSGPSDAPSNQGRDQLKVESHILHRLLSNDMKDEKHGKHFLPTSPLQDAMVAAMEASNLTTYFNHDVLRLDPDTDARRLLQAIGTVVKANPVLRTTFTPVDDPTYPRAYAQVVHSENRLLWERRPATADRTTKDEVLNASSSSVDMSGLSGLFFATVTYEGQDRYLIISIAHALYDGWSLALFHQDIRQAYEGRKKNRPSYHGTLAEILSNSSGEDATTFWQSQLQGVAPSILQGRADAPEISTVHKLDHTSHISAAAVKHFCKVHGVTIQSLSITCWAIVLAHHLRTLEVVFGIVLSGRDTPEANEVMFPTMNTVAFRSYISGTASELVSQTQDDLTAIREYQHFPLAKAKQSAGFGGQALFNTLFIYQALPKEDAPLSTPLYTSVESSSSVDVPVCVEAELDGDTFVWRSGCAASVLDQSGAKQLLQQVDAVLHSFVDSGSSAVVEAVDDGFSLAGLPPTQLREVDDRMDHDTTSDVPGPDGGEWSETETVVRQVISTIAQVALDSVTKHTTLYHAGLDSISAIKVSRSLREKGLKMSVTDLLRLGSVSRISHHLETANAVETNGDTGSNGHPNGTIAAPPSMTKEQITASLARAGYHEQDVQAIHPATAGQVYMLATWLASEGALFYPEFEHVLQTEVKPDYLASAWSSLCQENLLLRTCFVTTGLDGIPFASVVMKQPASGIRFATSQGPRTSPTQPFATLTAESRDRHWILKLSLHHALYDGVTLPGLFRRLEQLCEARGNPEPRSDSTELSILRSISQPQVHAQGFWKSYLSNTTPKTLGLSGRSKGRVESFNPQVLDNISGLRMTCSRIGVSIHAAFLAVYARCYARLTKPDQSRHDVLVGVYLANRSHGDGSFQETAAPTVNLVPLRVRDPVQRGLEDVAKDIQQDLQQIGRFEHCFASLWQLYSWTGLRVDTFVNFLDLPSHQEDPVSSTDASDNAVQPPGKRRQDSYSRVVEASAGKNWCPPKGLEGCPKSVLDAYIPSLDVEAAVVDGALAIGVFGPETAMGGEDGAAQLMSDIRHSAAAFCEQS